MTLEIGLLLGVVAAAGVCFAFDWVSAEVVGLGVLLALVLLGLLPADRAFEGFGSDAAIMILGLLIMTAALVRTGGVEVAGRAILRWAGSEPRRVLVWVMGSAALLSAFISNTAATAMFLPVVMGISVRMRVSPSALLLPLAFASILTSSVTLVSTTTNIVVSEAMSAHGLAPLGMFELAPVGIPIALVGLLYMLTVGRRLVPQRSPARSETPHASMVFFSELVILEGSALAGRTLREAGFGSQLQLKVLRILRGAQGTLRPLADAQLVAGDVLLVEGTREQVLKVKDAGGIEIRADAHFGDPNVAADDLVLVEALVGGRSELLDRTLAGLAFRQRFGVQVLAVHRHGEDIRAKLSELRFQLGDILLLQGTAQGLSALGQSGAVQLLGPVAFERTHARRAPLAAVIFAGSLVAGSLGIVPLPVAAILGAFLVFVTRCLTPEEAYRQVEWKAILLVGSMLALGAAMQSTGAAGFLADSIAGFASNIAPVWLLAGFFLVAVVLTQPMSNQAAAIVLVPVAVAAATRLGLNPRPFALTIAVAASCSYLTPLEPSCLLVYGPGRYHFGDFLRVGLPLTLVILVLTLLIVPAVWPLRG